jgi:hypothetical protein
VGERGVGGKLPGRDGTVVLRVDPGDLTVVSLTQTAPGVAASAVGAPLIGMDARIRREDKSMRVTVWSSRFATHSEPAAATAATGRAPTARVAVTEPFGSRATTELAGTATWF